MAVACHLQNMKGLKTLKVLTSSSFYSKIVANTTIRIELDKLIPLVVFRDGLIALIGGTLQW